MNADNGEMLVFTTKKGAPAAGRKDYIKRCVAGPGSTIEIKGREVFVDGRIIPVPPTAKFGGDGQVVDSELTNFKPLHIPSKGDTIHAGSLETREFFFFKKLLVQENPGRHVRTEYRAFMDGTFLKICGIRETDNWMVVDQELAIARITFAEEHPGAAFEIKPCVFLDDNPVDTYLVRYDNYFMLGDSRDKSFDSRFWGYVNRNFVRAKAIGIYYSVDRNIPLWQFYKMVRWDRLGTRIR